MSIASSYSISPKSPNGKIVAEGEVAWNNRRLLDDLNATLKFEFENEAKSGVAPTGDQIPHGAFEIVTDGFRPKELFPSSIRIKDKTKIDFTTSQHTFKVIGWFRTGRLVSADMQKAGKNLVQSGRVLGRANSTITVNATGNTLPSQGLNGGVEILPTLSIKPADLAGKSIAEMTTYIDGRIDTAVGLSTVYDSTDQNSGYSIYGATIRNSVGGTTTQSIGTNTAGISGLAVVWNITGATNADGTYNFSALRIKILPWMAVIVEEPDKDVSWTVSGTTVTILGPGNTTAHGLWHLIGFQNYRSLEVKMTKAKGSKEGIAYPDRKIGMIKAAKGAVKESMRKLESVVPTPGANPANVATTIIQKTLTSMVWEGVWHVPGGSTYQINDSTRNALLPWNRAMVRSCV